MRWQAVARWLPALSAGWRLAHCSERRLQAAPAIMHRRLSTSGPLPCMWNRPATGHEAPPFGTGIEAFGTGRASKFATEVFLHLQTGWPFTIVTAFAGGHPFGGGATLGAGLCSVRGRSDRFRGSAARSQFLPLGTADTSMTLSSTTMG